jgi:hypothetical protein
MNFNYKAKKKFWDFCFFIYIYKGMGDSSGDAIPEEWAASLPI